MLEVIKKRRSIRRYQKRKIEEKKLKEILKAAMFSPSAANRRPWEFILVKDPKTKEKLSEATHYANFAKEAPLILVVCADETKDIRWVEDCAIVTENIYLEATNQSLGTCFIQIRETRTPEGKSGEEYVKKLLRLPANIRVLCLMPLGYPAEQKEEHSDSELEKEKIHYETW